jgi:hypothetical protein
MCRRHYDQDYRLRNIDRLLKIEACSRAKNSEKRKEAKRKYYAEHPERRKKENRRYREKNRSLLNARDANRRALKLNATPRWLTEADHQLTKEIYETAKVLTEVSGSEWHVDHIIPLKGKEVCGLHCPQNLQIIPATENLCKSNKLLSAG